MVDRELIDLDDEDDWDFDAAVEYPGQPSNRAIVQVVFDRDEFLRVSDYMERNNLKLSECISMLAMRGLADAMADLPVSSEEPEHRSQ